MKKIWKIKMILTGLTGILTVPLVTPYERVNAEMSTVDKNRMLGATSRDWQSTSLREWLNSESVSVDYTALPPSYKDEPGFLSSQNFSNNEREGIAVTRHGHGWQYSLGGNTNDTLYYSQRSLAHNDYVSNDKVFILHYTDLVNYIEKNNLLMDRYKKNYSTYMQSQTNKRDKYDYLVNSGYYNSGYENVSVQYTSALRQVNARDKQDIVPALSLKPSYTFSNGKKANALLVGEVVTFGTYNGEPIEWEVINKSDAGYPLLWSTKILTTKEYDKDGDINPSTSSYINYPSYDVDIYAGNGQAKSRETQQAIDSTTTISFLNESVLTTPTNDTSITLQIKATDSKYGIRKMILPDGNVVAGGEASWTFSNNGEYDIFVENGQGVLSVKHFITKAINTPAVVNITTNKDESSKWTNKPVTVNISASNNGVYNLLLRGNREMGYSSASTGTFPAWMPLGGKRLHIKGTVRNALSEAEFSQVDPNAKVRIRGNYTRYTSSQRGMTYPVLKEFSLKELYEKKEIEVDEVIIMPSDIYQGYYSNVSMMDSNTAYMKSPYNYWISDFTYEILDKDDLKIEEITFPDGSKINSDTASYVITENGSYTFSAKDSRGKVTSKTIQVAVDVVKPTLSITGVQSQIVKNQMLRIEGRDGTSGVKRIRLPNGEYRTAEQEGQSLIVDYNIIENGDYTFLVEDYAGNTTSQKITITNVDSTAPVTQETLSKTTWTNQPVTITLMATDAQSGVKSIELPNGTITMGASANYTVSKNGDYRFATEDMVGNQTVRIVKITNIDVEKPNGMTSQSPVTIVWTNESVVITLSNVTDTGGAGISQIKLPDGTMSQSNTVHYAVSENGVYRFTIYDKAGNSKEIAVNVQNIDRVMPKLIAQFIPGVNGLTMRFTGYDELGEVHSIVLPNHLVVSGTTADFVTTQSGSYSVSVIDKAGNKSSFSTKIENPDVSLHQEINQWTNRQGYPLLATGNPKYGEEVLVRTFGTNSVWVSTDEFNQVIQSNGVYTFEVNDGGILDSKPITVTNFDRVRPVVEIDGNNQDGKKITVNIKIGDKGDKKD